MGYLRVLVTGPPGVGKTTLVRRVADYARDLGLKVFGFVTVEIREGGSRVGFKIIDINGGKETWLAHVSLFRGNPMVGKYYVNTRAMEEVGIPAIRSAGQGSLLIVDEIGKMELLSRDFLRVLEEVTPKVHFLGTVFTAYKFNPGVREFVERFDFRVVELSRVNRDLVYGEIVRELGRVLGL
jgi:nucleoside-triphosphatase